MRYSEAKEIITELRDNFEKDEIKDIIAEFVNETDDFEIGGFRFIKESEIEAIFEDYLKQDPYSLGCFSDWFIADNSDLSYDIVKALQDAGKFDTLGDHIIDNDFLSDFAKEAIATDGYGNFFGTYDGNEYELNVGGIHYYYFRIN
jgi:hypothetical protein